MKVLVAEDEIHIREGLTEILENEGYQVIQAENGLQAWTLYQQQTPDFICLDIMMPEINGYDVCRKIRKENETIPIIFITAKTEEIDKVLGLELGADDYIAKPFGVKEVIARIRAVTRRYLLTTKQKSSQFQMGEWAIFSNELKAKTANKQVDLSLRDIKILQLLFTKKGQVVTREELFNFCWGRDYLPNSRTLDQAISKLRKQIEKDPKYPEIIHTIHGVGYRFE